MKLARSIPKILIYSSAVLLLCTLLHCSISAQKASGNFSGNVYVHDTAKTASGYEEQVQAIRIDAVKGDTLLVKYKIGTEQFMDLDFVWDEAAKAYRSLKPLTYGDHAQYKDLASLQIADNTLSLQLQERKQKIQFQKRYNKPVDLKTHRDPYYAEDGFPLEP